MPNNTTLIKFKPNELKAGDILVTESEVAFECLEDGCEYPIMRDGDGNGLYIECLFGYHDIDSWSFACDDEGYAKYIKKKGEYVDTED